MKKPIIAILTLILTTTAILTSCQSKETTPDDTTETVTEAITETLTDTNTPEDEEEEETMDGTNIFRRKEGERPFIISHGSARELGPDNALVSFEKYMTMDVDFIEMDLCITQDDILITHHDEGIFDNSPGGSNRMRYIRELTFDQIAQINIAKDYTDIFGNKPYTEEIIRVANLEELLERYGDNPKNIRFMIEIKNTGENGQRAAEVLAEQLVKYNMQNKTIVCAFDEATMAHFRKVSEGKFYTSTTIESTLGFVTNALSGADENYECPDQILSVPTYDSGFQLDTQQLIDYVHAQNMSITYWTINDKPTMRALIEKGADGIITDRPDLMHELLIEMGFITE
jgi:Glycerophosphoryl diester phosphodiesterase